MIVRDFTSTCERAIRVKGIPSQVEKAQEEMHELLQALDHYKDGRVRDEAVITEIADVMITVALLMMIFGQEEVENEIERKVKRLKERLDSEEKRKPVSVEREYYGC